MNTKRRPVQSAKRRLAVSVGSIFAVAILAITSIGQAPPSQPALFAETDPDVTLIQALAPAGVTLAPLDDSRKRSLSSKASSKTDSMKQSMDALGTTAIPTAYLVSVTVPDPATAGVVLQQTTGLLDAPAYAFVFGEAGAKGTVGGKTYPRLLVLARLDTGTPLLVVGIATEGPSAAPSGVVPGSPPAQ